jgi:nucleotide-binding universal stress UspA family protein
MEAKADMLPTAQTEAQARVVSFKRLLVATDFSDVSQAAQLWGLALAHRCGSEVYFAHASSPEGRAAIPMDPLPKEIDRSRIDAESQMKMLADQARAEGIASHTMVEQGAASAVIPRMVQETGSDLLVVGTHGRGGLKKLVLGSVAEELLRLVSCPVFTVGRKVAPIVSAKANCERILFATDFGLGATKALPYALFLAKQYSARLVLLHMVSPIPAIQIGLESYGSANYTAEELANEEATARQESKKKLKQLLLPETERVFEPEYVVAPDFLPEGILQVAAERKAGLIVMGATRPLSARVAAHMPRTFVHRVLCEAECPVLTAMA